LKQIQHGGTVGSHLGIKRNFPRGHTGHTRKILLHHKQGALAVLDRLFSLGKLRRRGCGHGQRRGCQQTSREFFHGGPFVVKLKQMGSQSV
jgi:hypothetical protein